MHCKLNQWRPETRRTSVCVSGLLQQAPVSQGWLAEDIAAGLPRVNSNSYELFIPQMLNLDLLDGINFKKGCYTGQEIIARIIGHGAYSKFKFESGTHRVQRVPETESQGRIHTSACTVAILAERDSIEGVDIQTSDLRIDTFRASGAGGQHVNTTDSAIRITHLPTGLVVECQDERSQHKNKARAMSLLQARIMNAEIEKQQKEQAFHDGFAMRLASHDRA